MKKLNKLEIISIILILIISLTFLYTIFKPKVQACTTEAKICNDGTVVARVGENCEFAPCPDVAENRVYCTEEQKQGDACIEIYQPVCGYPNKESFSNSCFACMDEDVLYWVDGICE